MPKDYKYYEMDGEINGFAILKPDIDKIFSSLELAKIYCMRNNISDPEYGIYMKDIDAYVPYHDVEEVQDLGFYEWYDLNNIRTIFHSKKERKVIDIGYMIFKDGDSGKFIEDYKEGKKELKNIFNNIYDTTRQLSYVENIKVEKFKETMIIHVPSTTAELNISTVPHMLWQNGQRKAYGEDNHHSRALPYLKNMDRWMTIYTYITIDKNEFTINYGKEKIKKIRDKIIDYLNDIGEDLRVRYHIVPFGGTILI